ncbi:MAG: hypothetical protein VXX05_00865, partial [Candidatus Thermoplasmatota archaeon]|nr:hypothetical protein [Candidatus Thermoplasmatota archaeon]
MGFARTAVGVLFISVLVFYLSTVGQLTDEAKWGFVGAMAVLAFLWINLGGRKQPARARARRPAPAAPVQESVGVASDDEDEQEEDDLPAPVVANSLDGATLRERKLAKIAAAEAAQAAAEETEEDVGDEPMIEVEIEDVHVADEFVVDVSPESVEDADIEVTVR